MQTPIGKGLCTVLSVQLLYAHIAQHLVGDMELSTEGVAEVKLVLEEANVGCQCHT